MTGCSVLELESLKRNLCCPPIREKRCYWYKIEDDPESIHVYLHFSLLELIINKQKDQQSLNLHMDYRSALHMDKD